MTTYQAHRTEFRMWYVLAWSVLTLPYFLYVIILPEKYYFFGVYGVCMYTCVYTHMNVHRNARGHQVFHSVIPHFIFLIFLYLCICVSMCAHTCVPPSMYRLRWKNRLWQASLSNVHSEDSYLSPLRHLANPAILVYWDKVSSLKETHWLAKPRNSPALLLCHNHVNEPSF